MNCWECFQSCGKVCQNIDDEPYADPGHTICCGPRSDDQECRDSRKRDIKCS